MKIGNVLLQLTIIKLHIMNKVKQLDGCNAADRNTSLQLWCANKHSIKCKVDNAEELIFNSIIAKTEN